ncbi:MAG: AbrB/MazE/SpoVT family DNA-binding domain-containing protein [Thermoplasmataceae archaeon]
MARTKGNSTKLVSAKTQSDSLRATVPSFVVKAMDLDVGDELNWAIDKDHKETIIVKVIRGKKNDGSIEKN